MSWAFGKERVEAFCIISAAFVIWVTCSAAGCYRQSV
jgi:hypothetical protein